MTNVHSITHSIRILLVVAAIGIPARAAAEPATGDSTTQMFAGVHGLVVLPQGDADRLADNSLGVRGTFAYQAHRYVAAIGSIDYVLANEEDFVGDTDIQFYSIDVGARFTWTEPDKKWTPFAELLVGRHTVDSSETDSESDLGFRLGGGVMYRTISGLRIIGQLSYSTAEIERADINASVVEGGVGWAF